MIAQRSRADQLGELLDEFDRHAAFTLIGVSQDLDQSHSGRVPLAFARMDAGNSKPRGGEPSVGRPAIRATKRPRTAKGRTREVAARLAEVYPEALCELHHTNPFELLAATILSAQSTDARINIVTPVLFKRYPTPHDLAHAEIGELEEIIRSTGFYVAKAKSLAGMANALVERFDAEVPRSLEDLVTIPGVGRKTANVVRSVAFGLPGLPVDTHVIRLSNRLGLTAETDPVKIEHELNGYLPAPDRGPFSLRMILHGRRVCDAKHPRCGACSLEDICPSSRLRVKRTW